MLDNYRDKNIPIGFRSIDPHIYELDEMLSFCRSHNEIYICGTGYEERMMFKLLKNSPSVPLKGYVKYKDEIEVKPLPDEEIISLDAFLEKEGAGIILGLKDEYYRRVIPIMKKCGRQDYFVPTEWNKHAIAERMTLRDPEYNSFEVSLTDHCNMSCQMCDHYAQLSDEWFVDPEELERDLNRMSVLCGGKCAVITLLGGEPLLHPQIIRCLKITREAFPKAPLTLLTNGIKLIELEKGKEGNIWQTVKELNYTVSITRYPIKLDYDAIKAKAVEYGVNLALSSDIHSETPIEEAKISYKHTFRFDKDADNIFFPACHYYNHLGVVKGGKYYMCPVSAHINIFNKKFGKNLEHTKKDYIDIYKAESWEEIAKFQANRIPFCEYCDIRKWGSNSVWKPSSNSIDDYT